MDLMSSYWQIVMAPREIEKTAFTNLASMNTRQCPWDWPMLHATLSVSWRIYCAVNNGRSSLFILMISLSLGPECCTVLTDRVMREFGRLLSANLKLKSSKCAFFQ